MSSYEGVVSTERCVEVTGLSKYEVAVLVAKRGQELVSGAQPLVPVITGRKCVSVALSEMASGELDVHTLDANLMKGLADVRPDRRRGKSPAAKPTHEEDDLESLRESIMAAVAAHKAESGQMSKAEAERLFSGESAAPVSYESHNVEESEDE
jgi:DNA-directed RNA polymerase subunit K/omega